MRYITINKQNKIIALVTILLFLGATLNSIVTAYEVRYSYDDAGRLNGAFYTGANNLSYTYDNAGNMLNRRINDPDCLNHGDVDGNGDITAQDAQQAFYIVLGFITPTPEQLCAADCNDDESITASDAQAIFMVVLFSESCADTMVD